MSVGCIAQTVVGLVEQGEVVRGFAHFGGKVFEALVNGAIVLRIRGVEHNVALRARRQGLQLAAWRVFEGDGRIATESIQGMSVDGSGWRDELVVV